MITAAINVLIYTGIFLIVGLIKPGWALFFMRNPDRFMVIVFSVIGFMVAATLFGEGKRQEQLEQQATIRQKAPQIKADPEEIPIKAEPSK